MIQKHEINSFFNQMAEDTQFSAAVLVADKNGIVLKGGYGNANDSNGTPVTSETIFDIGSISKQFTATAILQLESQGLLNINTSIDQYITGIPEDKTAITPHHLLTHSAGFVEEHSKDDLAPQNRAEALQAILGQTLGFSPGDEYVYSKSGYTLLAAIIENITKQQFTDYLHQNFFNPNRMNSTGFYNGSWIGKSTANGYYNDQDQGKPSDWDGPYWGVIGNGGVMSTVGDLYIWWQALQNNRILPPVQKDKLFTRHVEEFSRSYYGYGWTLQETPFGDLITHNGGGIGGNSDFAFYKNQEVVIIIASNRINIHTDDNGDPTKIDLPATKARINLAYALFS